MLGSIIDADEKQRTVEMVRKQLSISPSQVIVVGDGAIDLKMIGIASQTVAYRARPVVRAQTGVASNFAGLGGVPNMLA